MCGPWAICFWELYLTPPKPPPSHGPGDPETAVDAEGHFPAGASCKPEGILFSVVAHRASKAAHIDMIIQMASSLNGPEAMFSSQF